MLSIPNNNQGTNKGSQRRNKRGPKKNKNTYRLRKAMYDAYEDAIPIAPLNQNRVYPIEMRFTTILSSNAGNGVQFRTSLTNLSRVFNGSGTYLDATQWATVFDLYRIIHIKYEYIPIQSPNTIQIFPIIIVNDIDDPDVANLSSYDEATEYQNKVFRKSDEPWSYNCHIPVFSAVPNVGVTSTTPAFVQNGFLDFAQYPQLGAIKVYADSNIGSTNFGRLIVTARVLLKRQR